MDAGELVRQFLRGQNLEQVGREDEALALYEAVIAEGFDSAGPYDRLIAIYGGRALHRDVVRVAEAALSNVRAYEDKRGFYEQTRREALKAQGRLPRAAPRKRA